MDSSVKLSTKIAFVMSLKRSCMSSVAVFSSLVLFLELSKKHDAIELACYPEECSNTVRGLLVCLSAALPGLVVRLSPVD